MSQTLKVYWRIPASPDPDDGPVLSFLPPSIEEEFERGHAGQVIRARQAASRQRGPARELYVKMAARLGTISCRDGRTFRQALSRPGEASLWWYHACAIRDCEHDPALNHIIALLTIQAAAAEAGAGNLVLCGAPAPVARALAEAFPVTETAAEKPWSRSRTLLTGLVSRAKFALLSLRDRFALRNVRQPSGPIDVALAGFWDWSVRWDEKSGTLSDPYFKRLPEELRKAFSGAVGWLAWLDPHSQAGSEGRTLSDVLAPLSRTSSVVILQSFLKPWETFAAALDFSPLRLFLRVERTPEFRAALRERGLDFYPLFAERLLGGFADARLPIAACMALATERACRRHRPKTALTFLEHFRHSRAFNEGVRRAQTRTARYAIQHCSYNHEKTFFMLDCALEFRGEPDGCAIPRPDGAFAMGSLGRELFLECGYPEDRVWLTGSTRYDHVRAAFYASAAQSARRLAAPVRVLLVPTLNFELELEMVDAACAAVKDLKSFQLLLRNHPFYRMDKHPRFKPYRTMVASTQGTLAEDIEQADLILFVYSTAAEEAYLKGKPVWQWLPCGFNASALAEAVRVPQFASVKDLREGLLSFAASPESYRPGPADRALALERLFHTGDGAAKRIADFLARELAPAKPDALSLNRS